MNVFHLVCRCGVDMKCDVRMRNPFIRSRYKASAKCPQCAFSCWADGKTKEEAVDRVCHAVAVLSAYSSGRSALIATEEI